MCNISFTGNTLTIDDTTVTTPDEIVNIIELDDRVIAHFESWGETSPRNIISYDLDGNILWQIDPAEHEDRDPTHYTGITKITNDQIVWKQEVRDVALAVIAFGYNSRRYHVNIKTGEVTDIGWCK